MSHTEHQGVGLRPMWAEFQQFAVPKDVNATFLVSEIWRRMATSPQ